MKRVFNFKVLNKNWKVKRYSDKVYFSRFGSDSHGQSDQEAREISIRESSLNKETILHELVHAYEMELGLVELELDEDQMVEFFCELFARHGEDIVKLSSEIFLFFKPYA